MRGRTVVCAAVVAASVAVGNGAGCADSVGITGAAASSTAAGSGGMAGTGGSGGMTAATTGVGGTPCMAPALACGGKCVSCSDACLNGGCCGDGLKNGAEDCDGADLGGATCASAVAPGWIGSVSCAGCKLDASACTTPATTYTTDLTDKSKWEFFDLVKNVNPNAKGFAGTAFDGQHVYFVPFYLDNMTPDGFAVRFDSKSGFTTPSSWEVFPITTINSGAKGLYNAAFDGHYVYYATPHYSDAFAGLLPRYDITKSFTDAAAWTVDNLSPIKSSAKNFNGAAFDGKYLYFAPGGGAGYGIAARFDTTASVQSASSWKFFDVGSLTPCQSFEGATFEGHHVYFAPYHPSGGPDCGVAVRVDTKGEFDQAASWEKFDIAGVDGGAKGFKGAVAAAGHVYFLPSNYIDTTGVVAQYDPQGDFTVGGSWAVFKIAQLNIGPTGFRGGTFDGRYLYLAPYYLDNTDFSGNVVRYDTTLPFTSTASWTVFDITKLNAAAKGFEHAVFDGKYVYFAPSANGSGYDGLVARFDAKSPSWLPKNWKASFY